MYRRFFSTVASGNPSTSSTADETPSDQDMAKKLRVKRRLSLLPRKSEGLLSFSPNAEEGSPGEKSDDELMAERCQLRRKRLSSFDRDQRAGPNLQRFAYIESAAKRARRCSESSPLSRLDQGTSPSSADPETHTNTASLTPAKNPFAKTRRTSGRAMPVSTEDSEAVGGALLEENFTGGSQGREEGGGANSAPQDEAREEGGEILTGSSSAGLGGKSLSVDISAIAPGPSVGRPFMTSADYITTRSRSSLLDHVVSLAQPNAGQDNLLLGRPTFTDKPVQYV